MSIIVYWACLEDQWMLAKEPESVSSIFYKKGLSDKNNPHTSMNYCPAFNKNLHNLYALRSLYDYDFSVVDNGLQSKYYDQKFFDDHVQVRSLETKFFSFRNRFIFFTPEKSLNVTFYEHPYLEDNNVSNRCMIVTGQFDIGKWFRNTEFAFYLKKEFNTFKIERDEIFSYIRFHTDQKIIFKQFRYNDNFASFNHDGFKLNFYGYMKTLENYYKNFKNKNLILKKIKENLV
jgi:hypothetical protein